MSIRPAFKLVAICIVLLIMTIGPTSANAFEPTSKYSKVNINGWTVYFSSKFAKEPKARKVITAKLQKQTAFIAKTLPAKHVKVMRKADIWVEPGGHYRALARHHAFKGGIYQEKLNPQKYRDVEIFGMFADVRHPSLVLHELAHVYHDRKLGWSDSKIERIYDRFAASMPSAKDKCGKPNKAYALENHNEFFATFTEAYFYKTCNYPYSRAHIQKHHPQMYALLKKAWGG